MSQLDPDTSPTHARVRVLFIIDASASTAKKSRLEAIDSFLHDMQTDLACIEQTKRCGSIEVQAIRYADRAEWHVRQATRIADLTWPPLPQGGGRSMGAALTLAASALADPSARDVVRVVVLIANEPATDDFAKGLSRFNFAATDRNVFRTAIALDSSHHAFFQQFTCDRREVYEAGPSEADLDAALRRTLRDRLLLTVGAASAADFDDPCENVDFVLGAGPPDLASAPKPPHRLDHVLFTIYRPTVVEPKQWKPLLAFVHLGERRPDAPANEPDPIEQVRQQAHTLLGAAAAKYRNISADARQGIPKGSEITLIPDIPGVLFNPRSRTFRWHKDVHREEFDLNANASLDGQTAHGSISAYLGVILIARIDIAIKVDSSQRDAVDATYNDVIHAAPYRKIFASYSRRDAEIVRQFEQFIETTGDRFLQDVRHLRAGEKWDDGLLRLIDQADVFQLFWSSNSMGSPHVRREWEYALSLGRPAFIRPTFWEDPFPESPKDSLPPESLRRLHFHRLADASPQQTLTFSPNHQPTHISHTEMRSPSLQIEVANRNRPMARANINQNFPEHHRLRRRSRLTPDRWNPLLLACLACLIATALLVCGAVLWQMLSPLG